MLPQDPHILLSYVNTRLRDGSAGLEDFCAEQDVDQDWLESTLAAAGYRYRPEQNRFA
ncbi:MAG: DUF4250 domain-containing protein [Lawsonibacter sp.]|nr:DUF4250 domain-containing protein [Lawsonibacter sp.]